MVKIGNHCRWLISKKGREYRKTVELLCTKMHISKITQKIEMTITAYLPDKRKRDLDNLLKALWDSMEHGGVYEDDSLVHILHIEKVEPPYEGTARVEILITEL